MVATSSFISRSIIDQIKRTEQERNVSLLNLSSGLRSDAGVADFSVGTLLSIQGNSLRTAIQNAGSGKTLLETADAAIDEIITLLGEQKTLATQAADASLSDNERATLNAEFQSLKQEIDRIASTTSYNNKVLLDGSISGTESITSSTGQASENFTLLAASTTTLGGTVAGTGGLAASPFNSIDTNSVGDVAGTGVLTFTHSDGTTALGADATIEINGTAIDFGNGVTTATALATAFVTAAETSTNADVRSFTYADNGDGTVTVTGADLGADVNALTFELTDDAVGGAGGTVSALDLGSSDVSSGSVQFSAATGVTAGADRSVAAGDVTYDNLLLGGITDITASLDTSTGPQNQVTFTATVNGETFTSQAINLFGTGGFNSQGDTIKSGQVITFVNQSGPTDANGEFTNNAFSLTVDASDITLAGGDLATFTSNLNTQAAAFETQLADASIYQQRDVVFTPVSVVGSDFAVNAAQGTILQGIETFDSTTGANALGDISLETDDFGDDGSIGRIGQFTYNTLTDTVSTTIDGVVYSADLTDTTADTGGFIDGAGGYNSSTKEITIGAGTSIVFQSATTGDNRKLTLDLSNVEDTTIALGSTALIDTFEGALNTVFGVNDNDSLSFQVSESASDTIGVTVGSALSTDLYINDSGISESLDISTSAGAAAASDTLDNAINNALSVAATINAGITRFSSAINVNTTAASLAEDQASALLNTDILLETTLLAARTLQYETGLAILAQQQAQTQSILRLLGDFKQ